MEISWIPGGLIGFRKIVKPWPKGEEKATENVEYQEGAILALRKGGEEALFACSEDDSKIPAAWIPIAEFVVSPLAIATEEDFLEPEVEPGEEEGLRGGHGFRPVETDPSGQEVPRRRSAGGNIRRREGGK